MKHILFLSLTFTSCFLTFGQNFNQPIQQKWQSNFVIGSNDYSAVAQQETIRLDMVEENVYGTFLELKSDGTFSSYNQGFCGNECRVRTTGIYTYNSKDSTINFTLTDINYAKMCIEMNKKEKLLPSAIGMFKINPTDNGYELARIH